MIYTLPKYFQPIIYKIIKWHYRKPRRFSKRGIDMVLYPSVFHPSLYLSTDIFLDFILNLNLNNGNTLELGCGNGLISLYLAKHTDMKIYASDINPQAVEGISENAKRNNVVINAIHSDLFDKIESMHFDFIFINPPFYKAPVKAVNEHAFYAGQNLEYFEKLFSQLNVRKKSVGKTYMILSENAATKEIVKIAQKYRIKVDQVHQQQSNREWFYIYLVG